MIEIWDTSALIVAARDQGAAQGLADALADDEVAITEPILLEYLNGARNLDEYGRFDVRLRAARLLETTPEDWRRDWTFIASLLQRARATSEASGSST